MEYPTDLRLYTRDELFEALVRSGFRVKSSRFFDYWGEGLRKRNAAERALRFLHKVASLGFPSLRDAIIIEAILSHQTTV